MEGQASKNILPTIIALYRAKTNKYFDKRERGVDLERSGGEIVVVLKKWLPKGMALLVGMSML